MPGGLLNIIAYGNQNVFLNGNPSKTFFKTTYSKYTNFGLQKFRIDFDGQRTLRMSESSVFDFTVPRYGDLLMDTYMVVNLPNIWSPVMPPQMAEIDILKPYLNKWQPYEFKWIENIGTQMIERVRFTVGGAVIQEFTGSYLINLVERDFTDEKKRLYYEMTGNVAELNDPANSRGNGGAYPNAVYIGTAGQVGSGLIEDAYRQLYDQTGSEPSIRGRQLYVPLNIWFTLASKMAFPLVSLQYAELRIEISIRPVQELYTVRRIHLTNDAATVESIIEHIQPSITEWRYQFYRFLQSPPTIEIDSPTAYKDHRTNWNADIHLISTYAFLTKDEVRKFVSEPQKYMIKQAYTTIFENVVGSRRLDLKSLGVVSNWMWFFQRTDVASRNQWSNYTNWPYSTPPFHQLNEKISEIIVISSINIPSNEYVDYHTGLYTSMKTRDIMNTWALILDGKYRENQLDRGVLDYVEKYVRTSGAAPSGLYCYNFALNSDPFDFQPSGALNMSKFSTVQFEVTTIQPILDPSAQFTTINSPITKEIVGVQVPRAGIYKHQYNMVVMEERYNILNIQNGVAGLEFAR